MFLIVGLGNPGKEYQHTRHNVGFDVVDLIANKYNININGKKFKGEYGKGTIGVEKVILLKPSTYMNLSGESVIEIARYYRIPNEKILVIYDDISLEISRMRIRKKGSAGGHNGIKNIIYHLGNDVFPRIKIGVGQPVNRDLAVHVLGRFSKEEREKIEGIFQTSVEAVELIVNGKIDEAMNEFNC